MPAKPVCLPLNLVFNEPSSMAPRLSPRFLATAGFSASKGEFTLAQGQTCVSESRAA
jgi:hypothetical protein